MKNRLRSLLVLSALCGGLVATSSAQTALPPPPPLPPPAYGQPPAYGPPPGTPGTPETPRGNWRNLSPEQREAIRRLSQEERQALANRNRSRNGEAAPQSGRLSIEERRQLREQIREEHERRGLRAGGPKRP